MQQIPASLSSSSYSNFAQSTSPYSNLVQPILFSGLFVVLAVYILPASIDIVSGMAQVGLGNIAAAQARSGSNPFLMHPDKDIITEDDEEQDDDQGHADNESSDVSSQDDGKRVKMSNMSTSSTSGTKYPGLLNAGGNTCFLNSTLQALASVPSLPQYLSNISKIGQSVNVPTPMCDNLLEMITQLSTPSSSRRTLHPRTVIQALYNSSPTRRRIINNDQQDAHEFFVMLTDTVSEELQKCEEELGLDQGLAHAIQSTLSPSALESTTLPSSSSSSSAPPPLSSSLPTLSLSSINDTIPKPIVKNPFKALMAHRTSCLHCGYTEAVRHLPSEQVTINVPSVSACDLHSTLKTFTSLEVLDEFYCRKCAVTATHARLSAQLSRLTDPTLGADPSPTPSKKRRIKDLRKNVEKLSFLCNVNPEAPLPPGINALDRPTPRRASKQTMFARSPQTLVIHLSRSTMYTMTGQAIKNNARVEFPMTMDLSQFSTSGMLTLKADAPMSTPSQPSSSASSLKEQPSTTTTTAKEKAQLNPLAHAIKLATENQNWYSLVSVVVHYGSHSFGHYITYRKTSHSWIRVSDESVYEASEQEVLNCNPFLLIYEKEDISYSSPKLASTSTNRSTRHSTPSFVSRASILTHPPQPSSSSSSSPSSSPNIQW